MFPKSDQASLNAFYGKHDLDATGVPTKAWETQYLTIITTPYPMRLSWDTKKTVTRITCHVKVADSLQRVLKGILAHYGNDPKAVHAAGMDLFGGCYNFRLKRGGSTLSIHSWGAAIDLDPARNGLGVPYDASKGMMPPEVVKIFTNAGWQWGGLWTRPDAMHFQATQ